MSTKKKPDLRKKRRPDPHARACELVGRFLYHFSRMELELDNAIIKLFKLDPERAPIITANIDFFKKVNIVWAAVNHPRGQGILSVELKSPFTDIAAMNDHRQVIAHCAFEPDESGGVKFKRTIAKKRLEREDPHWTKDDFDRRFASLEKLTGELKTMVTQLEPKRMDWEQFFALAGPAARPHMRGPLLAFSDEEGLKPLKK